jgi:hypothetical protein
MPDFKNNINSLPQEISARDALIIGDKLFSSIIYLRTISVSTLCSIIWIRRRKRSWLNRVGILEFSRKDRGQQ